MRGGRDGGQKRDGRIAQRELWSARLAVIAARKIWWTARQAGRQAVYYTAGPLDRRACSIVFEPNWRLLSVVVTLHRVIYILTWCALLSRRNRIIITSNKKNNNRHSSGSKEEREKKMKEEKSQRASIIGQIAAAAALHILVGRGGRKIIAQQPASLISGRALPPSLLNPIKRGNTNPRMHASIATFIFYCRLIPNFGISGTSRRDSHTFSCFPSAMQLF